MTHIITSLCLRDSACVDVCPVECIVGGEPESEWPWFYIDPDTCIDCGACVAECPLEAISSKMRFPQTMNCLPGRNISPTTPRKRSPLRVERLLT